jgi:F-type H+-transporting ATPase subunit b
MLDLNSSLFWIFFLVCGLYLVLTRIFFKPIGKIIDEREAKIAVDSNRLQGMLDQVEMNTQALETQMDQARKEALQIREEWSRKGEDVRSRALSEAKEKAARIMEEKMSALESEMKAAEKTLEKEIVVFSEKIKQAYL